MYLEGENLKDGSGYRGIGLPTEEGDFVGGDSVDFETAVVSNGTNDGDLAEGDWGEDNGWVAFDSFSVGVAVGAAESDGSDF